MEHRFQQALIRALVLVGLCFSLARSEDATQWKAPASAAAKKNPIPADQKSIAAGKALYAKNCAMCHGPAGKGDGPQARDLQPKPHDLSAPQIASQSDGALFWKTTTGRRPMPMFGKLLSDEERWHLVNYIRSFGPATPAQPKQ